MATLALHDTPLSPADALDDDSILFDADFDAEELSIIDHLLVQANSQIASPALAIADPDDYEGRHPSSSAVVSRPLGGAGRPRDAGGGVQRRGTTRMWKGKKKEREPASAQLPGIEVQYDEAELEQWIVKEGVGKAYTFS